MLIFLQDLVVPPSYKKDVKVKVHSSSPSELHFKVFAMLWAMATLFHMAHSNLFDTQLYYTLLSLTAIFVIFRPSVLSFTLLISLQVGDVVFKMPMVSNHWLFTAFVNITILQSLLYVILKRKSFQLQGSDWLEAFAPVVRIQVLILYFFAVFHKLNTGFFSASSSCATDLLIAQKIDSIILITPGILTLNAYFTIAIELLIPIFLCIRKTRNIAIIMGIVFHCALSYNAYNAFYDFSSMILALYFLFVGPAFSRIVYKSRENYKSRVMLLMRHFSFQKLFLIILCAGAFITIIHLLNKELDSFQEFYLYFFWTIYCLILIFCFVIFLIKTKEERSVPLNFSLPHKSFIILLLIVFLNGVSPYLGFKTENSYSMFSNLRTEGGVSNHFIMPASFQLFDYQKNVVEILSSSDAYLQKMANDNTMMVLFEFRNYINNKKPASVEYLLNGKKEIYTLNQTPLNGTLSQNSFLERKLLWFKPFFKNSPQPCTH